MASFPVEITVEHVSLKERSKRTYRRSVLFGLVSILCLGAFLLADLVNFVGVDLVAYILLAYVVSIACQIMFFSEPTEVEIRAHDESLFKGYKLSESESAVSRIRPCTHHEHRTHMINYGTQTVYLNDPDVVVGQYLAADPTKKVYYYGNHAFLIDLEKLQVLVFYS